MPRRTYTDKDRAAVRLALEVNDGNVKRTARDTGVPYMTVSNWKAQWEKQGLPAPVAEILPTITVDFIEEGVQVRDIALVKIKELVPQATIKDLRSLATLVGILDDKIRLAQGLATSRSETVHVHEIDPESVGKQIGTYIGEALEAAQRRADVIDGTLIEDAVIEEQGDPPLLELVS